MEISKHKEESEYLLNHYEHYQEERQARAERIREQQTGAVEPKSFVGLVDRFFRSQRRTYGWVVK